MSGGDLELFYPEFIRTLAFPLHAGERAFIGVIQPFANDELARLISRRLAVDLPVSVLGGRLSLVDDGAVASELPFESKLVSMATAFKVALIVRMPPKQPLVYVLSPEISRGAHPSAPHLRDDLPRIFDTRKIEALCVFSGHEFVYAPGFSREKQFLDQVSIYLAKHVVWMRTRTSVGHGQGSGLASALSQQPCVQLLSQSGIWLGSAATGSPEEHLSIPPNAECWCGEGNRYVACCRQIDLFRLELTRPGVDIFRKTELLQRIAALIINRNKSAIL